MVMFPHLRPMPELSRPSMSELLSGRSDTFVHRVEVRRQGSSRMGRLRLVATRWICAPGTQRASHMRRIGPAAQISAVKESPPVAESRRKPT